MSNESSNEKTVPAESSESLDRRLFLRSIGKWSGAAIAAAVTGGAWLASLPVANAGAWINGGGGGGGWINRRGGGGGAWVNRW